MNRQRHAVYGDRRKVLEGADIQDFMRANVEKVVRAMVANHTEGFPEEWELDALWDDARQLYAVSLKEDDFEEVTDAKELADAFADDAMRAYDARQEEFGDEQMRDFERQVFLAVLDRKWRDHLYEMDYLREGIGLRAMAQKDPLVEYKNEGAQMYDAMYEAFTEEVVGFVLNQSIQLPKPAPMQLTENPVDVDDMLAAGPHGASEAEGSVAQLSGSVTADAGQAGAPQPQADKSGEGEAAQRSRSQRKARKNRR